MKRGSELWFAALHPLTLSWPNTPCPAALGCHSGKQGLKSLSGGSSEKPTTIPPPTPPSMVPRSHLDQLGKMHSAPVSPPYSPSPLESQSSGEPALWGGTQSPFDRKLILLLWGKQLWSGHVSQGATWQSYNAKAWCILSLWFPKSRQESMPPHPQLLAPPTGICIPHPVLYKRSQSPAPARTRLWFSQAPVTSQPWECSWGSLWTARVPGGSRPCPLAHKRLLFTFLFFSKCWDVLRAQKSPRPRPSARASLRLEIWGPPLPSADSCSHLSLRCDPAGAGGWEGGLFLAEALWTTESLGCSTEQGVRPRHRLTWLAARCYCPCYPGWAATWTRKSIFQLLVTDRSSVTRTLVCWVLPASTIWAPRVRLLCLTPSSSSY